MPSQNICCRINGLDATELSAHPITVEYKFVGAPSVVIDYNKNGEFDPVSTDPTLTQNGTVVNSVSVPANNSLIAITYGSKIAHVRCWIATNCPTTDFTMIVIEITV